MKKPLRPPKARRHSCEALKAFGIDLSYSEGPRRDLRKKMKLLEEVFKTRKKSSEIFINCSLTSQSHSISIRYNIFETKSQLIKLSECKVNLEALSAKLTPATA